MPFRPPRFARRVIALLTWSARDRDMEREMQFHLDAIARENVAAGMTPGEAERAARARFGQMLRMKEQGHDVRSSHFLEGLVRDIRHMGRGLRKSPGFTTAVVLTLALGIGGNTAIFSVVDQLLLRPLPYPRGDELVAMYEVFFNRPGVGALPPARARNVVSPANWLDWQRESRTLQRSAAWRSTSATLTGVGEPARLNVQIVSWEFFPVLEVPPLLGRTISQEDDRPNARNVVILSHHLWQTRFGGDAGVVGRIVRLNDNPTEIIGVMPAGFRFIDADNDLWTAFRLDRAQAWRETAGRFLNVVGRLQTGTPVPTARAEMEGIAQRLAAMYAFNKNTSINIVPLRDELTGKVQTSLLVLYAAVGVLLAIACLNVANLLLARAAARRREIAIRTSLGAGRLAIIRQLLVESVLLAGMGGLLGAALASWSLKALVALAPPDLLRVPDLAVDLRVLGYTVGLSVLTGLVVGIVPAVLVAGESIVASIRSGGLTVTHAPRIRQALVIGQVAMSVMLLCGAGLLVRTLVALNEAPTGVDTQNVLTMEIGLPGARYDADRRMQFYRQVIDRMRELPGVESAAAGNSLAVIGTPRGGTAFHRLGTPELPMNERPGALIRVVTPGYFRTMRIPVQRGREFTPEDDARPAPGFVVNEAFAKAFLSDIDPLTASLTVWMQEQNPYAPVIGVVGDVSEGSIRSEPSPTVYYSHRQMPEGAMTLVVRAGQPSSISRPAVDAIHQLDPNLAVSRIRTYEGAFAESLARDRLTAIVSAAFATSGLLITSLGLYGLLAFLVTERTKEIGIRIALGAQRRRLTQSVVGGGLRLSAIGAAIGVVGAFFLLRSLKTLLFGVTPNDVTTYAVVLALLCAVATLASYVPARWAARVEPLKALRQE
jgi:predicted permease